MTIDAFYDLIDKDPQPPILGRATLRLLRTEEGGRKSGIRSGYRPNHNFGGPEYRGFYVGQIEYESGDTIELGETREVMVRFIPGPNLKAQLHTVDSPITETGLT